MNSIIACVHIPKFLLQLSKRNLANTRQPVVLVDRKNLQSVVLDADKHAVSRGVNPGLPLAKAVVLCPDLHAVCPDSQQICCLNQRLIRHLGAFSPEVEPVAEILGAYYLDTRGMERLQPDIVAWSESIQSALLEHEQLNCIVVTGFTRFGVRTVACASLANVQFECMDTELEVAYSMPLAKLNLPFRPVAELEKLEIRTVGKLLELPDWEVKYRFSDEVSELMRKARDQDANVHGIHFPEPYFAKVEFEHAQSSAENILEAIEKLCESLLKRMQYLSQGVSGIQMQLVKDSGNRQNEYLKIAEATLDWIVLRDLLQLRLHSIQLDEEIVSLSVHLHAQILPDQQLSLYEDLEKSDRSLSAANRAIARVNAEFGSAQVLRAVCQQSHLSKESFKWENFDQIYTSKIADQPVKSSMIRRVLDRPYLTHNPHRLALKRVFGPYSTSGFWWREVHVRHSEYFIETHTGDVQWICYDSNQHQWYTLGFIQ